MDDYEIFIDSLQNCDYLHGVANIAIHEGAKCIRIIPSDLKTAVSIVSTIRDIKNQNQIRIKIGDKGFIKNNNKLLKAFSLAGVEQIVDISNAPEKSKSEILQKQLELMPQDFIFFDENKRDGNAIKGAVLRPTYRCNESCHFCWLYQNQPDIPTNQLLDIIDKLANQGIERITFSGGEPTLLKDLPYIIKKTKELGIRYINLQTNATLLGQKSLVDKLVAAGLDEVFLALHSHKREISEEITGLKGSFDKTIKGLRQLLASPILLNVNHVITKSNTKDLPDFAKMMISEAELANKTFVVNFAIAQPMGRYEKSFSNFTPRISLLRKPLIKAMELLQKSEITFMGFTSACGPPLCAVGDRIDLLGQLDIVPDELWKHDFIKPEACNNCRLRLYCYGIREVYAKSFGVDEIEPIK